MKMMSRREFLHNIAEGVIFISSAKMNLVAGTFTENDREMLPYGEIAPTTTQLPIGAIYLQTDIPAHVWVNTFEGWSKYG